MSTDVLQNSTPSLWADPTTRWASATCKVLAASGSVLEEPSASVDSTSTTVASATNPYTLTLTSGTGVQAGVPYLLTDAVFGARIVVPSTVNGAAVVLSDSLPATPTAGATWQGVRVTATLTTTSTAALGEQLRAVFEGASGEQATAWFSVVRQVLPPAATERDVRAILSHGYSSAGLVKNAQRLREVASMASQLVRDRLRRMAVWPHLVGDPAPLAEAGRYATRLVLAEEHGLVPANRDPDGYVGHLRARLAESLTNIVHALGGIDDDNDGDFDNEVAGVAASVKVRR